MDGLQRRIQIARGRLLANLVLRNARLINVCSGECDLANVALVDGFIVGVGAPGENYHGRTEPTGLTGSVHIGSLHESDLRIAGQAGMVEVVGIEPGQTTSRHLREEALVRKGEIIADPSRDLLKLAVIERHHASGRVGLGLVKGFGLRKGALASSVAHDAHNLVIAGANDGDILKAAHTLEEMGGGFACVVDGEVLASVALPYGGLVSPLPAAELVYQQRRLDAVAADLGCVLDHPCMTLSFLSLSTVPALKLTDQGLIDVETFALLPLQR